MIALRRSRRGLASGGGSFACVGDDSRWDVAITCGEAQYDAPYNAKPSMKNVRIDDPQGALSWRSGRVIAGIADRRDLTRAPSSLGARINPSWTMSHLSRKPTSNARPGTPYRLVTLFADLGELDMRYPRELSADEWCLLRSAWRRERPPSWCRSPRSPTWRAHEQTIGSSRAKKPVDTAQRRPSRGLAFRQHEILRKSRRRLWWPPVTGTSRAWIIRLQP
jgi:hypothetical protein